MKFPGYETIEKYYKLKIYTIEDIKYFTKHGALTIEEYKKMTGEDYTEDTD